MNESVNEDKNSLPSRASELAAVEAPDGVSGLLPCPFCKASTLSVYRLPDSLSRHVYCQLCRAAGPWGESFQEAAERWNDRALRSAGWSKDKPTVDGWYWYRHNPEKYPDLPPEVAAPLMLMVYEGGTRCQDTVNDLFGSEIKESMDGLWSGPIVSPPLKTPTPFREQPIKVR